MVDNKIMGLQFRRGLTFIISCGVASHAFGQNTAVPATGDRLDDAAEVQLQQSLNDVYNKYNMQITGIKAEADKLAASGYAQCEMEAKQAETEAAQQESEAKMQAMQQMLGPGAQTLGHIVDSSMNGAKGENANQTSKLNTIIQNCNESGKYISTSGGQTIQVFSCTEDGVTVSGKTKCGTLTGQDSLNCQALASDANMHEDQIARTKKEVDDTGGAMDGLAKSMMELAAAGIGGMMANKQAKEMAGYLRENAATAEDFCKKQVDAQITALNNQMAQLEAAKARDLMMANMMAEYQTKVRRENQVENLDEEQNFTNGEAIDLGSNEPFFPGIRPVQTVPMNANSGSGADAPAGGGGGGSGGGGGGAPSWDFGGGAGFDGGSRLPEQPPESSYAGNSVSAANFSKTAGGFGALDSKPKDDASRDLASEEGAVIGDGGLRVLLARASMIHTRKASTLRKSIDFDRLAKSQGISPKPASVSPASPN